MPKKLPTIFFGAEYEGFSRPGQAGLGNAVAGWQARTRLASI